MRSILLEKNVIKERGLNMQLREDAEWQVGPGDGKG